MNTITLTGNIGKEIELKTTPAGKTVCSFSLAVRDGKDKTLWVNIVAWNKTAEILDRYAHKGSKIAVQGRLSIRDYTNKEGEKRYITEVVASNVELLDSKSNADVERPNSGFEIVDDDGSLPF